MDVGLWCVKNGNQFEGADTGNLESTEPLLGVHGLADLDRIPVLNQIGLDGAGKPSPSPLLGFLVGLHPTQGVMRHAIQVLAAGSPAIDRGGVGSQGAGEPQSCPARSKKVINECHADNIPKLTVLHNAFRYGRIPERGQREETPNGYA